MKLWSGTTRKANRAAGGFLSDHAPTGSQSLRKPDRGRPGGKCSFCGLFVLFAVSCCRSAQNRAGLAFAHFGVKVLSCFALVAGFSAANPYPKVRFEIPPYPKVRLSSGYRITPTVPAEHDRVGLSGNSRKLLAPRLQMCYIEN